MNAVVNSVDLDSLGDFVLPPIGFSRSAVLTVLASNSSGVVLVSVDSSAVLFSLMEGCRPAPVMTLDVGEQILEGLFLLENTAVIVTKSGKGFKIDAETNALPVPFVSNLKRGIAPLGECCILTRSGRGFAKIDIHTGDRVEYSVEGIDESEFAEDMRIDAVCAIGGDEFAFIAASSSTQDVIIGTGMLVDKHFVVKEYSLNEIFLSAEWTDECYGILKYVPELSVLIAGHSLSDSAALFARQTSPKPSEFECLLMPEGKQLTCSLVNGDCSSSYLVDISVIVLSEDEAIKMPRNNEFFDCRLVVITTQLDGWYTLHYGDLPSDWKWKMIEAPAKSTSAKAPELFDASVKPLSKEIDAAPAPELHPSTAPASAPAPSVKAPPAAKLPGLFDATVKAPPAPGLFDATVKAPSAPGLFDATVKAPPPSGLFDSKGKAAPSAPAPGLFDVTVKAPPAPTPGLFDASVKAPSAPGLFDSKVKATPSAPAPGLFDATVKAPPTPGLFDASVKAPRAPTPGLFDATVKAPPAPGLFDSKVKAAPSAPAPGVFDATVKAPPAPGLFDASVNAPSFVSSDSAFKASPSAATSPATVKPPSASGVSPFGQSAPSGGGLFGTASTSANGKSAFGAFGAEAKPSEGSPPPAFGTFGSQAKSTGIGLFAHTAAPSGQSAFGQFGSFGQEPKLSEGGLFAQQATPVPVGQSAFGSFGAKSLSNEQVTTGFGGSGFGQPASSPPATTPNAPGLFDATVKPSSGTTTSVFGTFGAPKSSSDEPASDDFGGSPSTPPSGPKPQAAAAVPTSPKKANPVQFSIDASVMEAFEKELELLEANQAAMSKPVPQLTTPAIPEIPKESLLEDQKNELLKLRDEMRVFDAKIRELYMQDPSRVLSEDLTKLESKFSSINGSLHKVSELMPHRPHRKSPRGPTAAPKIISSPSSTHSRVMPRTTPSSPSVTLFHPLPPSLRREQPAGLSTMTPLKPTPSSRKMDKSLAELLMVSDSTGFRRRESFTPRPLSSGKRVSLADLITGKILSSPEPVRSRPTTPELVRAPVVVPEGGHGAAWQLLRQIENQHRELDTLWRKITKNKSVDM